MNEDALFAAIGQIMQEARVEQDRLVRELRASFDDALATVRAELGEVNARTASIAEAAETRASSLAESITAGGARVGAVEEALDRVTGALSSIPEVASEVNHALEGLRAEVRVISQAEDRLRAEMEASLQAEREAARQVTQRELEAAQELISELSQALLETSAETNTGLAELRSDLSSLAEVEPRLRGELVQRLDEQAGLRRSDIAVLESRVDEMARVSEARDEQTTRYLSGAEARQMELARDLLEVAGRFAGLEEEVHATAGTAVVLRARTEEVVEDLAHTRRETLRNQEAIEQVRGMVLTVEAHAAEGRVQIEDVISKRIEEIDDRLSQEASVLRKEIATGAQARALEEARVSDIEVEVMQMADRVDAVTETAAAGVEALAETRALRVELPVLRNSVHEAMGRLAEAYFNPEPWLRGGKGYQAGATVAHNGGSWWSTCKTREEPGAGSDWVLYSSIPRVKGTRPVPDNRALVEMVLEHADRSEMTAQLPLPLPNFLGTWEEGVEYRHLDCVIINNSRFLAVVDHPRGKPGDGNTDYVLFAMHGPRGRKGESIKGDPPPVADVAIAFADYAERQGLFPNLTHIMDWDYGKRYSPMSAVRRPGGLYLRTGSDIPSTIPPEDNPSEWHCIVTSEGGAHGLGS